MLKKKKYFFSFNYGENDYGNVVFELNKRVTSEEQIKEVEDWLESQIGKKVIVMNFIEIK